MLNLHWLIDYYTCIVQYSFLNLPHYLVHVASVSCVVFVVPIEVRWLYTKIGVIGYL